jgi:hypothetical protein
MPPPETPLSTQATLLEARKLCELSEARIAELETLLEKVRANRDYWRDQAEHWQEQAQWLALPWWKRIRLQVDDEIHSHHDRHALNL